MALRILPPQVSGVPLIEILKRRCERAQFKRERGGSIRWETRIGFVYLVYFGYDNFYKIGQSIDPEYRTQSFGGAELPIETTLVHLIETDDMAVVESSLHEYFYDKHVRGEWFALNQEDVDLVKSMQQLSIHYNAPPDEYEDEEDPMLAMIRALPVPTK